MSGEKSAGRFDIILDDFPTGMFYKRSATKMTAIGKRTTQGNIMSEANHNGLRRNPWEPAFAKDMPQLMFSRRVVTTTPSGVQELGDSGSLDAPRGSSLGGNSARKVASQAISAASVEGVTPPEGLILAESLLSLAKQHKYSTILADPPWRFANRTGKMAPEHRRLSRYATLTIEEIAALPVSQIAADTAHLYLWVPNALLP